jgi:chromosomal replication initiation ATPase DnaA
VSQLTFKWPQPPSYAPEDFITSAANEEAVRLLETWPGGHPGQAALISGPEACGKTHLALSWAKRTRAVIIDADALGNTSSATLWQEATHAVLEDVHAITHETGLFHLLRHGETHGLFLLFTSRLPASQLPFTLPDLRSRLISLPAAVIAAPDEALLRGFLFKCFSDRQLRVSEEVIDYLMKRMDRSFIAAHTLVEAVEQRALEKRREITVPLVKGLFG